MYHINPSGVRVLNQKKTSFSNERHFEGKIDLCDYKHAYTTWILRLVYTSEDFAALKYDKAILWLKWSQRKLLCLY